MIRFFISKSPWFSWLIALCEIGIAFSQVSAVAPLPRFAELTDSFGDPLPAGAVARFGTRRLCKPAYDPTSGLLFTPNGKWLITSTWSPEDRNPNQAVQCWDVATGALVGTLGEQKQGVRAIALTPDGKRLATAGQDGSLDIWDLATRKRLWRLRDGKDGSESPILAFSSRRFLVCASSSTIQIWDLETRKKLNEYSSAFKVQDMALAPDGNTLALTADSDEKLTVLEITSGKQKYSVPAEKKSAVVFSPTGRVFATGGRSGLLRVHDAVSGRVLKQWQVWDKAEANTRSKPMAFTPDGMLLATGGSSGLVTLWNLHDGKAVRHFSSPDPLSHIAFSPKGTLLAGWELQRVRLLNTATGELNPSLPGHSSLLTGLAPLTEDLFASSGCDGQVLIWDRRKPFPIETYPVTPGHPDALSGLGANLFAFSHSRYDGRISLYRRPSLKPIVVRDLGEYFWATCVSPDGKLLACGDNKGEVILCPLNRDDSVQRLVVPREGKASLSLNCRGVAFSLDGKQLAVACSDGTLRLCDVPRFRWTQTLDGGERLTPDGFRAALGATAYDPTGLLLAARGEGKLILWNVRGELIRRVEVPLDPRPDPAAICFSPDGRFLADGGGLHLLEHGRSDRIFGASSQTETW
jgi:WD40 repeat protein